MKDYNIEYWKVTGHKVERYLSTEYFKTPGEALRFVQNEFKDIHFEVQGVTSTILTSAPAKIQRHKTLT